MEAREEAVANGNTLTVMRTEAVGDRIARQTWGNARAEEARAVARKEAAVARKEAAVVRAVSSAVTTRGTAAARALPRIEDETATGPSPRRAVVAVSRPVPVPVIVEISGRAARNADLVSARTVRLGVPTTQVASALRKGIVGCARASAFIAVKPGINTRTVASAQRMLPTSSLPGAVEEGGEEETEAVIRPALPEGLVAAKRSVCSSSTPERASRTSWR